ncbi:hypothetical protein QWY90_10805 [Flavobacterium paronense]|uniref:Lipoprotein n=1 Tax=Flavobacterium paronense TaxID=1392775 RepID=A0ABV5GD13_9FLAO|nr:hypothetical protein [Flavobacterium paronense]MDN3677799.1 hypothetical protein [Flavobacterium paronense]
MKNLNRLLFCLPLLGLPTVFISGCQNKQKIQKVISIHDAIVPKKTDSITIDTADYTRRIKALYSNDVSKKWKSKTHYPLPGAILPYKRVVAFYGNLYSKRMGILGELPKDKMLKKLREEEAQWQLADPTIPTVPALHYIAITAQSKPGKNNKYRLRMPFRQIDTIVAWANSIHGIVFLDVQIGQSSIKEEVNSLKGFLKLATVHLAIDPEFAMKDGEIPGTKIGTLSSEAINEAITILAQLVKENHLPPKILVIHRFTQPMVTDYQKIKTCPEVQIVMNMDGFGNKVLKRSSYHMAIYKEPVQFTGFKLFYKNDTRGKQILYTPKELLQFTPKPIYIQYQ